MQSSDFENRYFKTNIKLLLFLFCGGEWLLALTYYLVYLKQFYKSRMIIFGTTCKYLDIASMPFHKSKKVHLTISYLGLRMK